MIDQELTRLNKRLTELDDRIIPDLERKTERIFAQVMALGKGNEQRKKLEGEYDVLSKELRRRSDERLDIRRQMDRLEKQQQRKQQNLRRR